MTGSPPIPGNDGPADARTWQDFLVSRAGAWGVFLVLVALRALAGRFDYFFEQDEMSLAAGVAGLLDGTPGYLYHYGPQVGYYRTVQALAGLFGGEVSTIPFVMTGLSVVAGAALPAFVLRSFRSDLTVRQRLLAGAVATCLPVIWVSAQYGNSGILAAALVAGSVACLSNQPGRAGLVTGLLLYGASGLMRADAVLAAPVVLWLTWRSLRADRTLSLPALAVVGAGVAAAVALLLLDPGMASVFGDVQAHATDASYETRFWEHLTWGISPLVLGFAVWGWARATADDLGFRWTLLLWMLPVVAFYFGTTTTPRYFLLVAPPMAILAALGMERAAASARVPRVAWLGVLTLGFIHLFLGLGRFPASDWKAALTSPDYPTHDGEMPTGALVYQGYHGAGGLFSRSVRSGAWGSRSFAATGMRAQLDRIRDGQGARRVVALLDGWNAHVVHYHLREAGAELVSHENTTDEWLAPHVYRLGDTEITTLGIIDIGNRYLSQLTFQPGEEVWHIVSGGDVVPWGMIASELGPVSARPDSSTMDGSVRVYRLGATE